MVMTLSRIKPTTLCSTFLESDSSWPPNSGFLSALVEWLFGTIIRSPDHLGLVAILWSGMSLPRLRLSLYPEVVNHESFLKKASRSKWHKIASKYSGVLHNHVNHCKYRLSLNTFLYAALNHHFLPT